jgi:NTE family protein
MRDIQGRAVVLGGGGPVGTAWSIGFLHGMRKAGVDLGEAGTIVGTSAGAIAAAALTSGRNLGDLAAPEFLRDPPQDDPSDPQLLQRSFQLRVEAGDDPRDALRHIGGLAMAAAATPGHVHAERLRVNATGDGPWSHDGLLIISVDIETGERKVWTSADGVPLHLAAAASTAAPGIVIPVEINGRYYLDGGFANGSTNVDLADGADTTIIIEPLGHLFPNPAPHAQARIVPDAAGQAAMGRNFQDRSRWTACFEAGAAQATDEAAGILAIW